MTSLTTKGAPDRGGIFRRGGRAPSAPVAGKIRCNCRRPWPGKAASVIHLSTDSRETHIQQARDAVASGGAVGPFLAIPLIAVIKKVLG